ncbi:uncharacterized protein [Epargyreus clarus]|uniref:uncharacterized protein isoform X2 n=1 Tax=Epargyreus clarus TaxID=520877 RepID=UPI003C2E7F51
MESTRYSLRISEAQTLQLIELYEGEQCLWNTELSAYKNRAKRHAATERIARKLAIENFDAKHVAIKFKNLRNSYCQELKKMAFSSTMDDLQYKPKVFWFDKMDSFLRPHLQSTWGTDTVKEENHEVFDEPAEELVQLTNPEDVLSFNDKECKIDRKRPRPKSKEAKNQDRNLSEDTFPKDDIFDTFGKYVSSMLKSMPKRKAMKVQPKIVSLLTSANLDSDEDHVSQSDETLYLVS